jgi:hypothetical protein
MLLRRSSSSSSVRAAEGIAERPFGARHRGRALRPRAAALAGVAARAWVGCLALALVGCAEDDTPEIQGPGVGSSSGSTTSTGTSTSGSGSGTTGSSGTTATSTATEAGTDTEAATDTETGTDTDGNCGGILCAGAGSCEVIGGQETCVCDPGYALIDGVCEIDVNCVELRFLEPNCRQYLGGPSAVGIFFGLQFCSGDPILPDQREALGLEFVVLENGVDIEENVESIAQVIPREVENDLHLVIDVSDSITQSQNLPTLIASLRALVDGVRPGPGEPEVRVAISVFGRSVQTYQEFTTDLDRVDAALAAIEADPSVAVDLVNGSGTSLFDATKYGIRKTEQFALLRRNSHEDGVLGTGTVVIVTDGNDSSNAMLDLALINSTFTQVISVGISTEITDEDLGRIGRDGSFLAPLPEDWGVVFGQIAERVKNYPKRSYLLTYCSSATSGSPEVAVSVRGSATALVVQKQAVCRFNASAFSRDPTVRCNQATFDDECTNAECGGLTACGSCGAGECCDGANCIAPGIAFGGVCDVDEECRVADQICDETADACATPPTMACTGTVGCDPGVSWCQDPTDQDKVLTTNATGACVPALAVGEVCSSPLQCESLACYRFNSQDPLEEPRCKEPSGIADTCGPAIAFCETGTYCGGGICVAKKTLGDPCTSSIECMSGACADSQPRVCELAGACYWTWDEKGG